MIKTVTYKIKEDLTSWALSVEGGYYRARDGPKLNLVIRKTWRTDLFEDALVAYVVGSVGQFANIQHQSVQHLTVQHSGFSTFCAA